MKSLFFVPKLLIFEPCLWVFACQLRAQIVPFSSPERACFELNWCRFRAQEVILSSPNRPDFVPEPCIFRALFVLLLVEPCSSCYGALFVLLSSSLLLCSFEHWLSNMLRGKTWRYFSAGHFQQV